MGLTAQEVYAGHEKGCAAQRALGIEECEVEDILGDDVILPFLDRMIGSVLTSSHLIQELRQVDSALEYDAKVHDAKGLEGLF